VKRFATDYGFNLMIATNTNTNITQYRTAVDVKGTSAKALKKAFDKGYYNPEILYIIGVSDNTDLNQFIAFATEYPNVEVMDIRLTPAVCAKIGLTTSGVIEGYGGVNLNEQGEVDNLVPDSAFTMIILPAYTKLLKDKYGDGTKSFITKMVLIGNVEGQTFGGTAENCINLYKEALGIPYTNLISINNARSKSADDNYQDNPNYRLVVKREEAISHTCTVTPITSERYKDFMGASTTDQEALDFLDIEALRLISDIHEYSDVDYELYKSRGYEVSGNLNNLDVIMSNRRPGYVGLISLEGENWKDILNQLTYKNFIHSRVSDGSRMASKVFLTFVGGTIDTQMKNEFFKKLENTRLYNTSDTLYKQANAVKEGDSFRILIQFYGIKEKTVTTSNFVQSNNNLVHRDLAAESSLTMDMSDIEALLAPKVEPKVVYHHIGPDGQNQAKYNNWITPTVTTAEVLQMDGYLNLPEDEKRGVLVNRKQRNCL
jgi:hypothetical protein